MAIEKVALLGTRGRLGPWLLEALVESDRFKVTILLQPESTATLSSKYTGKVQTIRLIADFCSNEDGLANQLKGQDAIVMSIPASNVKEHAAIAKACVKAGVRRMIPADYGSVDSADDFCAAMVPVVYGGKRENQEILQRLSRQHTGFSWTSLVCGHFFDYGLETDLLAFDLASDPPQALVFDDGSTRWSASTRRQIGQAVVAVLLHEQETSNRVLYIQSFCTSQNEILDILERISGQSVQVTRTASDDYIRQKKAEMDEGVRHEAMEELVGVLGLTRADWTKLPDFANSTLGLEEESLEDEIKKIWQLKKQKKQ